MMEWKEFIWSDVRICIFIIISCKTMRDAHQMPTVMMLDVEYVPISKWRQFLLVFFSFYSHLTTPEQQWLCNPKSIGIWHTSMCDNKTHMTWIRFRHMPFNYGRFVICLHGLYSHFPNGVHKSISRNSSKIFLKNTSTQSRSYGKEIVPNNWTCKQMQKYNSVITIGRFVLLTWRFKRLHLVF